MMFDVAEDGRGDLWLFDVRDDPDDVPRGNKVYRIGAGGEAELVLSSTSLYAATGMLLTTTWGRTAMLPSGEEFVVEAGAPAEGFGSVSTILVAIGDRDGDGAIDPATEVRPVWQRSLHPELTGSGFGSRDVVIAPDGSLLVVWGGRREVHRFFDLDGDGDYDDPGEGTVIYGDALAEGDVVPDFFFPIAAGLAEQP